MTIFLEEESDNLDKLDFEYKGLIEDAARAAALKEGFSEELQLSVTLTDERAIREINSNFRDVDAVTDVLSFPMLSFDGGYGYSHMVSDMANTDPDSKELIIGDIVLCIPRIIEQAGEYGHSVKREFAFLVVHSMLHLFGYDHIEEEDRVLMEEEQRAIMEDLGISRQ